MLPPECTSKFAVWEFSLPKMSLLCLGGGKWHKIELPERKKNENFLGNINLNMDGSHCSNYKCTYFPGKECTLLDVEVSTRQHCVTSAGLSEELFTEVPTVLWSYPSRHGQIHLALPAYTTFTHSIQGIYISKCKSSSSPLTFLGQHQVENQDSSKSHPHSIHSMAGKRTGF